VLVLKYSFKAPPEALTDDVLALVGAQVGKGAPPTFHVAAYATA
jgi:hypothetical protein